MSASGSNTPSGTGEFFPEDFGAKQLGSNNLITGPGRCRKVEEKSMKHSVKFAGRDSAQTVHPYAKLRNITFLTKIEQSYYSLINLRRV